MKKVSTQILQGTLDLMILRTLAIMGPQHAYGIANRLLQISDDALNLNQGIIYPALVRLEQHGWTRGCWGKDGEQPRSEVLHNHKSGIESAEGRDRALAADGRCS